MHSVKQFKWYTYRTFNISEEADAPHNSFGLLHYTQRSWEEHVRKIHGPRSSYQVKNSQRRLDVDKPEGDYLEVRDELKFEKFREIFRATMRLTPPSPVVLPADEDQYDKAVLE